MAEDRPRESRAGVISFTLTTTAQILATIALVGGAFYWGGKMEAINKNLASIVNDHEERLRCVENGNPRCPR